MLGIWICLGLRIADGDDTIETFAYEICNTDGVDGLSWAEVKHCEVSIYLNTYIHIKINSVITYWIFKSLKISYN